MINRKSIIADFKIYVLCVTLTYIMIIAFTLTAHYSIDYLLIHEQYNLFQEDLNVMYLILNTIHLGVILIAIVSNGLYILVTMFLLCIFGLGLFEKYKPQ